MQISQEEFHVRRFVMLKRSSYQSRSVSFVFLCNSQAKLRSRIRIADGRAKPIDLLAKYITDQDEDVMELASADLSGAIEILEPTQFLVGLGMDDLEDLLEDIKVRRCFSLPPLSGPFQN